MKPLFSVCACSILKISSCFRMPEAPWMLRSFATCVSAEIFISLSWAMSMVGAPSGRSGATNFFELIGGFFSLWDVIYGSRNAVQDFILPGTRHCRKWNYLLGFYFLGTLVKRLVQFRTRNFISL